MTTVTRRGLLATIGAVLAALAAGFRKSAPFDAADVTWDPITGKEPMYPLSDGKLYQSCPHYRLRMPAALVTLYGDRGEYEYDAKLRTVSWKESFHVLAGRAELYGVVRRRGNLNPAPPPERHEVIYNGTERKVYVAGVLLGEVCDAVHRVMGDTRRLVSVLHRAR